MGRLKPGATYIYEKAGGVVYARESGSLQREAIGWDADVDPNGDSQKQLKESRQWREILEEAKSNSVLQEAIDRVKILYELSKKDGQK